MRIRLPVGLVIGVLAAVTVGLRAGPGLGILAGWLAGALVVGVWTWIAIWPLDADATKAHAGADAPGRRVTDLILLVCSIASLGAVGYLLLGHPKGTGLLVAHAILTVISVALAWFTTHTVFTLRYARTYYSDPEGGIDFNQKEPPRYSDFAYVAFTVGMSYAISDTNVTQTAVRRLALGQALISYLLGAVVIGATINLVVSLQPG